MKRMTQPFSMSNTGWFVLFLFLLDHLSNDKFIMLHSSYSKQNQRKNSFSSISTGHISREERKHESLMTLRMFYVYQRRENVDVDEMLTMRSHEY